MYDSKTKRQGVTWLSPKKPKAQKIGMQKSRVKIMLTAFLDAKGVIHHEFVPQKQTVNGRLYKKLIERMITRVHLFRPEFQEIGSWYLLHYNATDAFFGRCLRGFDEMRDPRVTASSLLPRFRTG
jgi:hypothetical protein